MGPAGAGGWPPVRIGPAPPEARLVVVGVHGRNQSAGYLVEHLVDRVDRPDVSWLLPRSPQRQWYQGRVHDPIETNEAELGAAIAAITADLPAIPPSRVLWVGFSQGGCVVAEILARVPGPWAGAAILAGALLGPEPARRVPRQRLDGIPVELAAGDADPWMAPSSAHATGEVFADAGARVRVTITPSGEHVIHDADIEAVTRLIDNSP